MIPIIKNNTKLTEGQIRQNLSLRFKEGDKVMILPEGQFTLNLNESVLLEPMEIEGIVIDSYCLEGTHLLVDGEEIWIEALYKLKGIPSSYVFYEYDELDFWDEDKARENFLNSRGLTWKNSKT
ncbi:MAG: hypothetical protein ACO2ZP_00530 [Bacteriovoracaceae bacterium]